jgi:hypothetical protein
VNGELSITVQSLLSKACTLTPALCAYAVYAHTLYQGAEGAISISYTVGGGASTATINNDYTVNGSGILTFGPGQTSASFTITILQDSLVS